MIMKNEFINSELSINDRLTENIYLVSDSEKVMKNISNCEIDIQVPNNKKEIGVRHSKRDDILISTLCLLKKKERFLFQFIILKGCDKNEVYQKEFDSFKGLENIIIQGIDIVNSETMKDILNISVG